MNLMRHLVGKAVMYVVYPSAGRPSSYMEKSISSAVERLVNENQVVPVVSSPINHTQLTEIEDPAVFADVKVVDEKTGGEVTLGSVMKPGDRLARCLVTHSVTGWHMPEQYEAARRQLATAGKFDPGAGSTDPEPVCADEVAVEPGGQQAARQGGVKPAVFL